MLETTRRQVEVVVIFVPKKYLKEIQKPRKPIGMILKILRA
jgi:hypothetical protein